MIGEKKAQTLVEERASRVRDQGPMATLDDALKRWFTPEYLNSDGKGVVLVREWRKRVDAESYAQAAWVLANGVRELIAPEIPINKPTLVITCENDSGSTPKMSEDIRGEISGAETANNPSIATSGFDGRTRLVCKSNPGFS